MRINGTLSKVGDTDILFKSAYPLFSPYGPVSDPFRVVGDNLPTTLYVKTDIEGIWIKENGETVFKCESFFENPPKNDKEVWLYFVGHGIPKKVASDLILKYEENAISMMDEDLELALASVRAKKWMVASAKRAWTKFRNEDLFVYLRSFGLGDRTIQKAFDRFGKSTLNVSKSEPYALLEIPGVSFETADKLARSNGIGEADTERIEAAIIAAIREVEGSSGFGKALMQYNKQNEKKIIAGSTCMKWEDLSPLALFILDSPSITVEDVAKAVISMSERKNPSIYIDNDEFFFREEVSKQEKDTARNIHRLLRHDKNNIHLTIDDVTAMQNELVNKAGLAGNLSEEQIKAVVTSLENPVSIITGGPGTGKTTIQTAILYLIKKYKPEAKINMIAPTGRAASRMTESSGYPATTIHSALGLYGDDEFDETDTLKSDVLVIDECSMLDSSLAYGLFSSIESGTKVILLGDVNQLPSVGAGAVLRELISSEVIPTALLTGVFRQGKGSSIASNAYLINDGKTDLSFDSSFEYVNADGDIQSKVVEVFKREVEKYGLDNVCVLSPFRKNTDTGVNQLNMKLQGVIPHDKSLGTKKVFDTTFYCGDRVMYTKNKNGLANGDVGTITGIDRDSITVDFGKNRPITLSGDDLSYMVLSYACTVHKSQGSEYKSVIFVSDKKHQMMLTKPIIYTALTRPKQHAVIVGEIDAFNKGISKEEETRLSLLSKYLKEIS